MINIYTLMYFSVAPSLITKSTPWPDGVVFMVKYSGKFQSQQFNINSNTSGISLHLLALKVVKCHSVICNRNDLTLYFSILYQTWRHSD